VFSCGIVFSDPLHESSARKISRLPNVLDDFAEQHHFCAGKNVTFDRIADIAARHDIAQFVANLVIYSVQGGSGLWKKSRAVMAWLSSQFRIAFFGQSKNQFSALGNVSGFHELAMSRSDILPSIGECACDATVRKAFQDLSTIVSMKFGSRFNLAAISASAC